MTQWWLRGSQSRESIVNDHRPPPNHRSDRSDQFGGENDNDDRRETYCSPAALTRTLALRAYYFLSPREFCPGPPPPPNDPNNEQRGRRRQQQQSSSASSLDELFLQAEQQQSQNEAYNEIKRLIIFAGVFFLFLIAFMLIKFQISLEDVFRWSPVVWLIGVIICGLLMNLFLHFRRFLQKREANRLRDRQNLLSSLQLPDSFPCLAPCCRHCNGSSARSLPQTHNARGTNREASTASIAESELNCAPLPQYENFHRCPLVSPPAFVVVVPPKAPPKYCCEDTQSRSSSEEDIAPPRYDEMES